MIKWFEKYWWVSLIIAVFGASLMFYISSLQFPAPISSGFPLKPLLYHLGSYFLLTAFLLFAVVQGKCRKCLIPVALVSLLYAVSDEIHQYFVPTRAMSLFDVMVDGIGILIASIIYVVILDKRNQSNNRL